MIIMRLILNFLLFTGGLWMNVLSNSESEKWSWPTSGKESEKVASNRKDIYYESNSDSGERNGRVRVPTSYNDNRRPYALQYQVKESTTNKPKPLSDEFSNEYAASGEGYNGNNRYPPLNFPNRFGSPSQHNPNVQHNDFPPFGYPPQGGAGGIYSQFGPAGFPGPQQYPVGGNIGGYPGQFPIRGGYPGGYPQQNNIANGILVGPGGPTGVFGRPRYPGGYQNPGYPGAYPQFGFQSHPQQFGFDGHHNGLGGVPHNPALAGGFGGIDPYNQQFANPYYQPFGGNHYGPQFDSQSKNSAVKNKVEKSAK